MSHHIPYIVTYAQLNQQGQYSLIGRWWTGSVFCSVSYWVRKTRSSWFDILLTKILLPSVYHYFVKNYIQTKTARQCLIVKVFVHYFQNEILWFCQHFIKDICWRIVDNIAMNVCQQFVNSNPHLLLPIFIIPFDVLLIFLLEFHQ